MAVCDGRIYLFWFVISYLCIAAELQESDSTAPTPLEQRVGEGEEGRLETEQASEAQEEAEPDSGLGESSVEGGEVLSTENIA